MNAKAMADREKKRGRQRYKNLNISRKKSFLDEIKCIFHSFLKGYQKIADISFKQKCQVREEVLETL